MIIRMSPENEEEKKKFVAKFKTDEVVHTGVMDYFIFGNKIDADNEVVDFHEWKGGYRYLLGSLDYYYNIVNDERRAPTVNPATSRIEVVPKLSFAEPVEAEAEVAEAAEITEAQPEHRMVKSGEVQRPDIKILDIEALRKNAAPSLEDNAFEDEEIPKPPKIVKFDQAEIDRMSRIMEQSKKGLAEEPPKGLRIDHE